MIKSSTNSIIRHLNNLNSINVGLLITVALTPTHWFWHWDPKWTYWSGIQMEPWIPKIFVSALAVSGLWLLSLGLHSYKKSLFLNFLTGSTSGRPHVTPRFRLFDTTAKLDTLKIVLLMVVLGVWTSLVSVVPLANLSFWVQMMIGPVSLAAWIWWQRKTLPLRTIELGILLGIGLQTLLAWWQKLTQHSLGGYWLAGQPDLSAPGVAHSALPGNLQILPYGSTPHPNVLAAWLLLGMIVWHHRTWKNKKLWISGFLILLPPFAWSESWTAWLGFLLFVVVWNLPPKFARFAKEKWWAWPSIHLVCATLLLSSVFFLASLWSGAEIPPSLLRRQEYLRSIPRLVGHHPWGWGLLQHPTGYTPLVQAQLGPLSRQPVHSAVISFGIDIGFWILFILLPFSVFVQKKYSYFFTIFTLLSPFLYLDHWQFSTISGQFYTIIFSLILFKYLYKYKTHSLQTT